MNEELQNALVEVINSATSAKDFILAEMPDVVHQLLMWKLVENLMVMAVWVLAVVLYASTCAAISRRGWWIDEYKDPNPVTILSAIVAFVPLFVGFFAFPAALFTAVQIIIAPKVYLIEYAAGLMR